MPIDHTSISVSTDLYQKTLEFYIEALKPLNYTKIMEFGQRAGLGVSPKSDFWIIAHEGEPPAAHVAFTANDRQTVDNFHAAAIAAGGKDNGAPGIRAHYHPNYYGAFVIDPAGNNAEVVCHV